MNAVNEDYWYNQWHLDYDLHHLLAVKDVTKISRDEPTSIYADTDSLFVSFKPAIDHCTWKNQLLNSDFLGSIKVPFVVLDYRQDTKSSNPNFMGSFDSILPHDGKRDLQTFLLNNNPELIIMDGYYIKSRDVSKLKLDDIKVRWNWGNELDFIHGVDYFRYAGYFKKCLEDYAATYGVENKEDFELERISESVISIAKKKYISHISFEDGINYDSLTYIYPKGVELVRSSTPAFARDKIVNIVKYLFTNPDTFNIRELLKLVKGLRREFELANIDDIAMQSSCSNYEEKVVDDKSKLEFVSGAHFAVKCSAYYNYLLNKNKPLQEKYEFIKSGTKIKYYYCKDKSMNDIFAYIRGSVPIEFAPEIDYDIQFEKCILSPINSIIEPLGMPQISKRLSVVLDIFGGF